MSSVMNINSILNKQSYKPKLHLVFGFVYLRQCATTCENFKWTCLICQDKRYYKNMTRNNDLELYHSRRSMGCFLAYQSRILTMDNEKKYDSSVICVQIRRASLILSFGLIIAKLILGSYRID